MKKAAIVCDKYKVAAFEKKLNEQGFKYKVKKGPTKKTSIMKVDFEPDQQKALAKICAEVQIDSSRSN